MTSRVTEAREALEKALAEERRVMEETAKIFEEKVELSMAIARASIEGQDPDQAMIDRLQWLDEKVQSLPRVQATWPLRQALKEAEEAERNGPKVP